MTSFMGPMAPPPAAPPQPQAMDFQTDPNNRQRFRQFLNNRMQPPMMQAPMVQPPAHMPPILPEVDIFAPQGYADGGIVGFTNGGSTQPIEQRVMKNGQVGLFRGNTFLGFKQEPEKEEESPLLSLAKFKKVLGLEDGGEVPPRRTEIGGNDHMLSYITPDEADILMALGGSGEAGPMGIPSYNPNEDRANEEAAADDDMGDSDTMSGPSGNDDGPDPFAGEEGDDFSDPNQNYGNDDGSFNPSDFVDYGVSDDATQTVIDNIVNNLNNPQQQAPVNLSQRLAETQLDPMGTLAKPDITDINEILDFDAGPVVGDIESVGTGIASVNTGVSKGTSPVGSLLGGNNLLGDTDAYKSALDRRSAERNMNPADFEAIYGFAPRGVTGNVPSDISSIGIMTPTDGLNTDNMNLVNTPPNDLVDVGAAGLGVDVPTSTATTTTPTGPTTSAPIGMDDEYDDVVGTPDYDDPNREGYSAGLPTGLDFIDTPQGRMTTNLAGTTAAQRAAMPGYMNTRNEDGSLRDGIVAGLTDFAFGNPVRNAYGFEIPDLATGQITGMTGPSSFGGAASFINNLISGKPETTEDLLQSGVYTGFGPGSQIGMDEGGDGPDQQVNPTADPCPPGYSLVNGTCTPVSDSSSGGDADPADSANPYISSPVIVPSPRQPMPFLGQMPSGYGTPVTGGVNPQVMSEMQKYAQLLSRPQPQYPVGLANGGPVSSNLDMAADNFLKALMPAA